MHIHMSFIIRVIPTPIRIREQRQILLESFFTLQLGGGIPDRSSRLAGATQTRTRDVIGRLLLGLFELLRRLLQLRLLPLQHILQHFGRRRSTSNSAKLFRIVPSSRDAGFVHVDPMRIGPCQPRHPRIGISTS